MIDGQARHADQSHHSSTTDRSSSHNNNSNIITIISSTGDLVNSSSEVSDKFTSSDSSSSSETDSVLIEGDEVYNNNTVSQQQQVRLSRQSGPTKAACTDSPAAPLSRSRSRGRSNPSQLLARKQQMMLVAQQQQQVVQQHDTVAMGAFDPGGGGGGATNLTSKTRANDDLTTTSNRSTLDNATKGDCDNDEIILSSSTHNSLTLINDVKHHHHHHHQQQQKNSSNTDLNNLVMMSSLSCSSNNGATTDLPIATAAAAAAQQLLNGKLATNSNGQHSHNHNHQLQQAQQVQQDSSLDCVYILLAKKEEEVQLAAELGRALLVKNEELSRRNECITEEYSHKLELLEQEKYALKRSLESKVGEFESKMADLQQDCNKLQKQLDEQQQLVRQKEKEKELDFDYLVQQNQRLTNELKQAQESEKAVSNQLEQMIDKFKVRLSNRQDHEVQLDTLREEIQLLSNRKEELERRLNTINCERNNLNMSLEESGDKIVILEKCISDKDAMLINQQRELDELRHANTWLINKLDDNMAASCDNNSTIDQQSSNMSQILSNLRQQHQISLSSSPARSHHQYRRPLSVQRVHHRRSSAKNHNNKKVLLLSNEQQQLTTTTMDNNAAMMDSNQLIGHGPTSLYDELELQSSLSSPNSKNLLALSSGSNGHRPNSVDDVDSSDHRSSASDCDEISAQEDEMNEMCQELMVEIYGLLKRFYIDLQHRKESLISMQNNQLNSPNSAEDSGISADDAKSPRETAQACDPVQWTKLLNNIKGLIEEMPCATCQLMIAERADYEHLQKLHQKLNDDMKKKEDQLIELTSLTTTQQVQLDNLKERNGILESDLENCDKPKEEIVKLAWKARDEAVQRKNNAEITLAKTRIENMQITSQLMEVVQQKGELSQRLAQFEDDMHYMTQDSVKAKFTWEEYTEKMRRANQLNRNNKITNTTNGLTQLLFSGSNSNGNTVNSNNKDSSSSLMNQLLIKRSFNLKFWQRSSNSNNNNPTTTDNATIKTSTITSATSVTTGPVTAPIGDNSDMTVNVTTTGTLLADSNIVSPTEQVRVAATSVELTNTIAGTPLMTETSST